MSSSLSGRLREALEGPAAALSREYRQRLCQEPFQPYTGESLSGYRDQVLSWCRVLAAEGYGRLGWPRDMGGDR